MISLKEVLAELKSESLNENVAKDSNNYCLSGDSNNYCLFGYTQPDAGTPPETPSQPDGQILIQTPVNLCLF
jgi:hypothetical protein